LIFHPRSPKICIRKKTALLGSSYLIPLKMSKIQPVNDYILIEPDVEPEKTASGIFIPDTADKEKPQKAKVIAVGPGKIGKDGQRVPLSVQAGNTVLYSKYGPTEVKIGTEEYQFIQESDVIAVIQ
jgi:chaperonin GroES